MRLLIFILILLGPIFAAAKVNNHKRVKNDVEESYCLVHQHRFSYKFDFTKLTNAEDYIIRHDRDDELRLQLCEPLRKPCNGADGYAICYHKANTEIGIGREEPTVIKEFGETIFHYTGDQCDKSHNYTVNIKMICDYAAKDRKDISWFPSGFNDCDFNVEWRTDVACTENREQSECKVKDKLNHEYDLSQLINPSDNYYVHINKDHEIILNVCHSIIYRPNSCLSSNAACLIDTNSNTSKNLGSLSGDLQYNSADGSLYLRYEHGAICPQNANLPSWSMTVTFICDFDAIGTLPKYSGGMENCHINVTWRTAAACSIQNLEKKSLEEKTHDVCAKRDPRTGFMYNFTALMNEDFPVIHPFGSKEVYKFRVCGPIINNSCKKDSGACKIKGSISGGIANSKLLWKETEPYVYLNYTHGDICQWNKHEQMYTILEFYCEDEEDLEIDERNELCHDVIKIGTKLACNNQQPKRLPIRACSTFDNLVSFEQLMLDSTNYIIKTADDTEYHLNICKPLAKEQGLNCPDEAAACKVSNVKGKMTNPINLGKPEENPMTSTDKSAVLFYRDGSECEENKSKKIESSISFLCDVNSELGSPVFKDYKDCTYYFEWKTSLICGKIDGNLNNDCSISNSLGDVRSLSLLNELMGPEYEIKSLKSPKTFHISLCGDAKHCNGSYVCDDKMSYGNKVSVVFDFNVNVVRFHFTDGSKCKDGSNARATLVLVCKEDRVRNLPVFKREDACNVEFEWHTSRICKSNTQKLLMTAKGSLTGGEIAAIVVSLFIIVLVVCYLQRRTLFMEWISNSSSRNCDRVKYSRVNTTEEVHLLMNASDPTVIETDSDDDLLDA